MDSLKAIKGPDPRLRALKPGSYCPLHIVPDTVREWSGIVEPLRLVLLDLIVAQKPWPLLLWGNTGSGKTCAALCVHDYFGGSYVTLPDLHQRLQDVRSGLVYWPGPTGTRVGLTEFWSCWSQLSFTAIDEIGLRKANDALYETLKLALDHRKERPMILVSNLPSEVLARLYDVRIGSRVSEATVVELKGDRRQPTRET